MEQKSDVEYRAEKLYKNSREKFGYIIREVVSNAIHASIIRTKKEKDYKPEVRIKIRIDEKKADLVVHDNGEGFTDFNSKFFSHLDTKNTEKESLNFHPQGQGRLAIVYFADSAQYDSVYKDSNHKYRTKSFTYPEHDLGPTLFDIEGKIGEETDINNTYTNLTLKFFKQQTLSRANTFFRRYDTKEKLANWFVDTFFPFFMDNDQLNVEIDYNGEITRINKSFIEINITNIPFTIIMNYELEKKYDFKLWLVKNELIGTRTRNQITCFARSLIAELENGKLEYEIDLPMTYNWLLTSDLFDDFVDEKGDKIELSFDEVAKIQTGMNTALNEHFKEQIERNKRETKRNIGSARKKYHSLSVFIDEDLSQESNKILKEADIVNSAIESKGKIEKTYWTNQQAESEDIDKLLNSSLQIYIDHRKRVLNSFHSLILKFDEEGVEKSELEESIHDLFLKRGQNLKASENINHLHNLWILDDKYTVFSETLNARSTKRGQTLSDIYLWIDDPEYAKELLILELKSTTNAHNAGDKYESMVAQVKRYANQFYQNPVKILNWDVEPSRMLYSGIILARKSDINRELNSNNIGGKPTKIPFLKNSYYFNESFSTVSNANIAPDYKDIRIEMYSYEDIYELSVNRNSVFFKLLNGEYSISET